MTLPESKQSMPVMRQLFAGLSFVGLLLFGPGTVMCVVENLTTQQKTETAGFSPFMVAPTIIFAVAFALLMKGYWSRLFQRKRRQEN